MTGRDDTLEAGVGVSVSDGRECLQAHRRIIHTLHHGSAEAIRAALETIDDDFLIKNHAEAKATVLTILGKSLVSQSLSSRRTSASALSVAQRIISLQKEFSTNDLQALTRALLNGLTIGLGGGKQDQQPPSKRSYAPGSALAFGLGAGVQTVRRKTSSVSLHNGQAESVVGVNWDTESAASGSEMDQSTARGATQDEGRLVAVCRIVRQRSIACLEILIPRVLLIDWPRIICESETGEACLLDVVERDLAMSNCVAACRACEALFLRGQSSGAFASANDRSRISFTSLSSRLASTIVTTRKRLIDLLRSRPQPLLVESVLRCLTTVVKATEKAKLRQTHEDALRPTALKYCASGEASIAIRAYTLLCALKESAADRSEARLVDFLDKLQDNALPTDVKAEAWSALSIAGQSTPDSRRLALHDLQTGDSHLRHAVARYVLSQKGADMEEHVGILCIDDNAAVRALGADCLGYGNSTFDDLARKMVSDAEPAVRAAAVRAIGVRIQAGAHYDEEMILQGLRDPSYLVRSRASWTFGNYCEARPKLSSLRQCLGLRSEDARLVVHAVRGVGAILAECPLDEINSGDGDVTASLRWLSHVLDKERDPKLRWNTCSALARSLRSVNGERVLCISLDDNINFVDQLLKVACEDRIFKTRLAACLAIRAGLEQTTIAEQDKQRICSRLTLAQTLLASQSQSASFTETQQHIIPLRSELDRILALM